METAKPTRTQLLAILDSLAADSKNGGDKEDIHGIADRALLAYINDPKISKAFESIDKWYA